MKFSSFIIITMENYYNKKEVKKYCVKADNPTGDIFCCRTPKLFKKM